MIERACARLVHGGTRGRFNGFQIEATGPAQSGEDDVQEPVYFAGDFLMDRFGRFFSCDVSLSSAGRSWQIFSLTPMKSRLIC
jgi:hypothetical protein